MQDKICALTEERPAPLNQVNIQINGVPKTKDEVLAEQLGKNCSQAATRESTRGSVLRRFFVRKKRPGRTGPHLIPLKAKRALS